jgi:hypothetical protein
MAKRRKPTMEDRVKEYVDSSSMLRRVKRKKQLSARITGAYGTTAQLVESPRKPMAPAVARLKFGHASTF